MHRSIIICLSLIFVALSFSFFSCKKKENIIGAENNDDNLGSITKVEEEMPSIEEQEVFPESTTETTEEPEIDQNIVDDTDKEIGSVKQWGNIEIAQENHNIANPRETDSIILLRNNNQIDEIKLKDELTDLENTLRDSGEIIQAQEETGIKKSDVFVPTDVFIGELEDIRNTNPIHQKIIAIMRGFVNSLQKGRLDEDLGKYVFEDFVFGIRRHLDDILDYGSNVTKIRIGKIKNAKNDANERVAVVRIFAQIDGFESHAILQVYFASNQGAWKIVSVEGSFNDLLKPYEKLGKFVPSGTADITQGF